MPAIRVPLTVRALAAVCVAAPAVAGAAVSGTAAAATSSGLQATRVAALSPAAGIVEMDWTKSAGDTFSVTDTTGGTSTVLASGLTTTSWTSRSERPGTHTYRLTRTPGDGSAPAWSEQTVLVPTVEVIGSPYKLWAAAPPGSNASGMSLSSATIVGRAAMSPDRAHLVVGQNNNNGASELWLTDLSGAPQRQLTNGAWDRDPAFSPDGQTLAFTRRATVDGPSAVYRLDLGAAYAEPTAWPGGANAAMPSWTPTGDAVVVEDLTPPSGTTQSGSTSTGLVMLAADGTRMALPGTDAGRDPSVSRTGLVAFDREDQTQTYSEIDVTDLAGAPAVRWSPTPRADWYWTQPSWNPQGDALALTLAIAGAGAGSGADPFTIAGPGATPEAWRGSDFSTFLDPSWVDVVDAAPVASLTAPATSVSSTVATTAAFSDSDDAIGGLSATCQLDAAAAQPCAAGSWTLSGLADGKHVLTLRVSDPAGKAAVVQRTVYVDQVAPAVTVRALPWALLGAPGTLSWSGTDATSGVASYEVRRRVISLNGAASAWSTPSTWQALTRPSLTISLSAGTEGCFQVRARDRAGNVGAWSGVTCTSAALDDRSLSASSGWTRVKYSSAVYGTATTTARYGVRLSHLDVSARRIGLVVYTCPTCGTISVRNAGVLIGSRSLRTITSRARQILWLPLTPTHCGTLTLTTTRWARSTVDGIVVGH